nr:reverse transcriptase domain-containing protein [Tanacetum cinerariifolium]
MKRTRSFIHGEAASADSKKSYSNYKSQEQPRRQSNDQSSNHNNSYRNQRGDRGNNKYTPLTKTPKEILATEGANFPKPPPMRTPEDEGKKDTPKDKADTIYMVQSWQRKTRQKKKQLCDNPFKDWCVKVNTTQHFASVKHPQTNGLVERANRSLGEGMKARLDKHKGRWVEELSHVLWAHRTTIKVSTGDTPFSLVYETEAVIPAKIGMPTIRTMEVNVATNDEERRIDLDLLEERRERAAICEAKAKSKMKGYYDAK